MHAFGRRGIVVTFTLLAGAAVAARSTAGVEPAVYVGPLPYTSEADSPFDTEAFGYCIEDFENGALDVPGATSNGGAAGPGGLADSVDVDDGAIDGSGTNARSYFFGNGAGGVEFTFDPERTHGLPTQVGIVWTDGGFQAPVTFEAFGPDNSSILVTPYGPFVHADSSNTGETAEDRFYGVMSITGIRRIVVTNTGGGIEVDHLQLDRCILCGDATLDLTITAPDALEALKASVGTAECRPCLCDVNDNENTTAADALAILRRSVGIVQPMTCPECSELSPL